jgi:hypothetical protein
MIRRALDREVERDFQSVRCSRIPQSAKILDRAERGMDRVMAAFAAADGVRAAEIVCSRADGIVTTFAIGGK